jgi:PqqA peptide cyclase
MRDTLPAAPPIAILAELTHRCPLSCPYCSNPVELIARQQEMDTATWLSIFRQAADMGVLQVHISGGEPASRRDLVDLVRGARQAGLYVNLITSGVGLTDTRLDQLDAAGVDHIQLSLQGITAESADWIGDYRGAFARKMVVAEKIAEIGFPLTLNAVMHRHNLDDLPEMIGMAIRLGARRIEVACVQFQGWALKNRGKLQPTREQVETAKQVVARAREENRGTLVFDFVPPDYYADFPKACMGGWGSTGLNITPDGRVLPCHAAETIPSLTFQSVADASLSDIWYHGAAFAAYRGTDWMSDLCKSCDRRDIDFGGCRCQAMAMAGDPAAADPVCRKSPHRHMVDAVLESEARHSGDVSFAYRKFPDRA